VVKGVYESTRIIFAISDILLHGDDNYANKYFGNEKHIADWYWGQVDFDKHEQLNNMR
jgi:hypothetical protein